MSSSPTSKSRTATTRSPACIRSWEALFPRSTSVCASSEPPQNLERTRLHGERPRFVDTIELPVDDPDPAPECMHLGGKRQPGRACADYQHVRLTVCRHAIRVFHARAVRFWAIVGQPWATFAAYITSFLRSILKCRTRAPRNPGSTATASLVILIVRQIRARAALVRRQENTISQRHERKAPLPAPFAVAGAGFEPATSGL